MKFYEFFAGGGMARIGLGSAWDCLFSNDIDPVKAKSYRANFGAAKELHICDVSEIRPVDLPSRADLAWASFPCQDLSLAGCGKGLKGKRSGIFWAFWSLMQGLGAEGRAPRMIVLENVYGAITSHKGQDLATICEALAESGYSYAPMVIDAQFFLPQSRPRLFLVAFGEGMTPAPGILGDGPSTPWHPDAFGLAYDMLSVKARHSWKWLQLAPPCVTRGKLSTLIEEEPFGVEWHTPFETKRLLAMMTPINREKVTHAMGIGRRIIGTVYKRTRPDAYGVKQQRAEVRFDEVAGCLRTPAGGSSRQIILAVEGHNVRSRLLSPREAARLMGLPEEYALPERYNDAYRLAGDGVAVPVVSWLARNVVEPSMRASNAEAAA